MLIASIMLAAKFLDDQFFKNDYYARIGGITVKEINVSEMELLKVLDYQRIISKLNYGNYIY